MPSRTGAVHRACTSAVPPVSHGPAGEPGPRKSLVVPAFAGRRPNPPGRYLTDIDAQPVPVGRIDRDREAEPAALLVETHPVDLEHRDPAIGGGVEETGFVFVRGAGPARVAVGRLLAAAPFCQVAAASPPRIP